MEEGSKSRGSRVQRLERAPCIKQREMQRAFASERKEAMMCHQSKNKGHRSIEGSKLAGRQAGAHLLFTLAVAKQRGVFFALLALCSPLPPSPRRLCTLAAAAAAAGSSPRCAILSASVLQPSTSFSLPLSQPGVALATPSRCRSRLRTTGGAPRGGRAQTRARRRRRRHFRRRRPRTCREAPCF